MILNLYERPEEGENDYFKDNIYTCQKFKKDLSKNKTKINLSLFSQSSNDALSTTCRWLKIK